MKNARKIIVAILVVLGAAAGVAKILQSPQELGFFALLGLGGKEVLGFGLVQLAGAVLLAVPRMRLTGAIISDLMFTLSAVMIFLSGAIGFGVIALVPAILAGFIVFEEIRPKIKSRRQTRVNPR